MIIERNREYTVNMGNYESVKIGARVVIDSAESAQTYAAFKPDEIKDSLIQRADKYLNDALSEDIEKAAAITNTRDSFILTWKAS